jgi:hypothetical protein
MADLGGLVQRKWRETAGRQKGEELRELGLTGHSVVFSLRVTPPEDFVLVTCLYVFSKSETKFPLN